MPSTCRNAIAVIQPGLLTTVQDVGRCGHADIGMPMAGAVDAYAARVGNLLVGNREQAAVLELTGPGALLEFRQATLFAVTGADMRPCLNQHPLAMWTAIKAFPGERLHFSRRRDGFRTYLAVSGGIDVPIVMGSASTYLRGRLGGFQGRMLQAGDVIPLGEPDAPSCQGLRLPDIMRPQPTETLRVILGPQETAFTADGIKTFLTADYRVTAAADRMGCRLAGPPIALRGSADILSEGIAPGAVQVPAHGQPILMLADRQTTGGYAKIATVISVDIPVAAQKQPGDLVRFRAVPVSDAQQWLRQQEDDIAAFARAVRTQVQAAPAERGEYTITMQRQAYHVRIEARKGFL